MTLPTILTNPTPKQLKAAGLALLVVGVLYYWIVLRPSLSYSYYVLGKYAHAGMDGAFVRAWAQALNEGAQTFKYNNKAYITSTGRAQ